jgi:hypothetical protein
MDTRLVDFSKPVQIELNGSTSTLRVSRSLKVCCETTARRADPAYVFSAQINLVKNDQTGTLVVASSQAGQAGSAFEPVK